MSNHFTQNYKGIFGVTNAKNQYETIFMWLFTCATYLHFFIFNQYTIWLVCLLFIANILLLIYPKWLPPALFALTIYGGYALYHFPRIDNHVNLSAFILIGLVAIGLYARFNNKMVVFSTHLMIPAAIGIAFSLYFFAGFHKLNTAYLNIDTSCVNEFSLRLLTSLHIPQNYWKPIRQVAIYASLFIEVLVPLGLFFSQTRKFSLLTLIIFHVYIALNGLSNFGGLGMLIIATASVNFTSITSQEFKRIWWFVFFSVLSAFLYFLMSVLNLFGIYRLFIQGVIFTMGVICIWPVIQHASPTVISRRQYTRITIPIILFMTCWSMRSYVGFGNTGNLTMYSNLVTESSRSNHLLINTKYTKLFDWEENHVYITFTDSNYLHDYPLKQINHLLIPKTELAYRIQATEKNSYPLGAIVIDKTDTVVVPNLYFSIYAESKWWYKYIAFRPIQREGPNRCRW